MFYIIFCIAVSLFFSLLFSVLVYLWRARQENIVRMVVLVFFVLSTALALGTWAYRKPIKKWVKITQKKEESFNEQCKFNNTLVKLPRDDYAQRHRFAAMRLPHAVLIRSIPQLESLLMKKKLEFVPDGNGFIVDYLQSSHRVLHPTAHRVLQEIGREFRIKLGDDHKTVFVVSSLTRTTGQQKKLAGTNPAATKYISTHSYGASFDISKFRSQTADCLTWQKALQSILRKKRRNRKLYICPEKGCFHITAI